MSNIPPPGEPDSSHVDDALSPSSGRNVALIIIVGAVSLLAVGMCVIGILVALLLPAIQSAKEAASRAQSANNMKQIGLAMHSFRLARGHFPPAYSESPDGTRLQSWRTFILPYMEQDNLWSRLKLDEPWNAGDNMAVSETALPIFASPRFGDSRKTLTNYVVITGPGTMFEGAKGVYLHSIRDGASNTIMAIEVKNSDIHWAEPRDVTIDDLALEQEGAPADHPLVVPYRANILFADGSVRMLEEYMTLAKLKKLCTRSDGEVPLP